MLLQQLFLIVPTVCCLAQSVLFTINGNWPMACVFFGYAFANLGLMAAAGLL